MRANGVERGEFNLVQRADGDYWVTTADLKRLNVTPLDAARRESAGQAYYSLRALGATALVYNEAELALLVTFPAASIEGTRIDLASRPGAVPDTVTGNSLILSYRVAARPALRNQPGSAIAETDLNLRLAGILLRQENRLELRAGQRRLVRGVSQALWDHPDSGTRATVGDLVSTAGAFGSVITGVGLRIGRQFEMTPDLVRQPTATLRTSTSLPAVVEVAADGTTLYRGNVGPGPVVLENLLLYGGMRNVRVTVTDASGRREVIEQPFLFTDSVLARGLHDFSWFIGRRSELGPDNAWIYREPAWQGYHRYGLNDSLTVGGGGEGNAVFTNAGLGAAWRSDLLGLAAADILVSVDRESGRRARGWALRYAYLVPGGAVAASRRRYDEGFRSFSTSALAPYLREETRLSASTRLFGVTLAADLVRSRDANETRDSRVLRATTNLARNVTLNAELQSVRTNGRAERMASIFLRADLDSRNWVSGSARSSAGSRSIDVEAGRQLPQGEGVGYRVGFSRSEQDGAAGGLGYLSASWNLRRLTLDAYASAQMEGGSASYAEVSASGALVAVPGDWGLSRRVADGFVLARLGVPQAGVEITLNNQLQGVTDAEGKLFIPQVGAFGRQDVALNDKQLGMQYDLAAKRRTIAPPYRSGTVVDFGGRKLRAVAGMAWILQDGRRLPLVTRAWNLASSGGATLAVESTSAGDFYLEDAAPGSYRGSLAVDGRTYSCRLEVPDFPEAVHEHKEGIVCE